MMGSESNKIDAKAQSMQSDGPAAAHQADAVSSLTAKSELLVNSVAKKVVLEYARSAIAAAVDSASQRADQLAAPARSSASVALSQFADSAYTNAVNYANPSEAVAGVEAFTANVDHAIDTANFSSANDVVMHAANSLVNKTTVLGASAADDTKLTINSAFDQISTELSQQADNIAGADSLAQSGVDHLESLTSAAVLSFAKHEMEATYLQFKDELFQLSDAVAQDAIAEIHSVTDPTYAWVQSNAAAPASASAQVSTAITSMNSIFASYGNVLVSAGVAEYASNAYSAVAYLSGDQLLNANRMIDSAARVLLNNSIATSNIDAQSINQIYGLIPVASNAIKSITDEVNHSFADRQLSAATVSAAATTSSLTPAGKVHVDFSINSYVQQAQSEVAAVVNDPATLNATLSSATSTIASMATAAMVADPYASAAHQLQTTVASADEQLSRLSGVAQLNATSAVHVATTSASAALDANHFDAAQLTETVQTIGEQVDGIIDHYANSAAVDQLNGAYSAADSMVVQLGTKAERSAARTQIEAIRDSAAQVIAAQSDVDSVVASATDTLHSTAVQLIQSDPNRSAHYAVQMVLRSATDKGAYLDAISRDNAVSEVAMVATRASSAMVKNAGRASALANDVEQASLAADRIIDHYAVEDARSKTHSMASSAHQQMQFVSDVAFADQAASQVAAVQNSMNMTLFHNSDQLAVVSQAVVDAQANLTSIADYYVQTDAVAAAHAKLASLASTAAVTTADLDEANRGNANREVAHTLQSAQAALSATSGHHQVAEQAAASVTATLNHYTLAYTSVAVSSAASSANQHLAQVGIGDDQTAREIASFVQATDANIATDRDNFANVLLDVRNGIAQVNSYVDAAVKKNPHASAVNTVQSTAARLTAERSAANYDFANFSSAVAKTTSVNCKTISQINDTATIDQLMSVADTENMHHYQSNVAASATAALSAVAKSVRQKLIAVGVTIDDPLDELMAEYAEIINRDASDARFAAIDQQLGTLELQSLFDNTIKDHPQAAKRYELESMASAASSVAAEYLAESVELDRDLYRVVSSATQQVNASADEAGMASAVATASAAMDAVVNENVAASALQLIDSAADSANRRVANIKDTGKSIDAQSEIRFNAETGIKLVKADAQTPKLVNIDVRNTLMKLTSMTSAAVGDDTVAATLDQINSMVASARASVSFADSTADLRFASQVDQYVDQARSAVAGVEDRNNVAPHLAGLEVQLTTLTDQVKRDSVNAQMIDAKADAKRSLATLRGQDQLALNGELDAITDRVADAIDHDLNDPENLKTDIQNGLTAIAQLVADAIQKDPYATAHQLVQSAVATTTSTADALSGSVANNLRSEIASANSHYADQLPAADDASVSAVASGAVQALTMTTNNYVAAYAANVINVARERILNASRAYSGVSTNTLERRFSAILGMAMGVIQSDFNDLNLIHLDIQNIIAQLEAAFEEAVAADPNGQYQLAVTKLKQSATAAANVSDQLTAANLSSALNSVASAADGNSLAASAQMQSVVNAYHADRAVAAVSSAATAAQLRVLRLNDVSKISTSAAIDDLVSSANGEISADADYPRYTSLDAAEGIQAINARLASAVANDATAVTSSVAASATSVAFERMGSMTAAASLVATNQIKRVVDRAVTNQQPTETLVHQIDQVADRYLIDSAQARLNQTADAVNDQLDTNPDQEPIIKRIQTITKETMAKVRADVKMPAYLALDVTDGVAALNELVSEYQTDPLVSIKAEINSAAQDLTTMVPATGSVNSNVSSAAASVARTAIQNIANVADDSNAVAAFTQSAADQFDLLRQSYVAESATAVVQSAISSAQVSAAMIADESIAAQYHDQFSGIADSFNRQLQADARNASLTALDIENAVLEINQITDQAVASDSQASAATTYSTAVSGALSAAFRNTALMTTSQVDNYHSAMAKVLPDSEEVLNASQSAVADQVSAVQTAIASVANRYYGLWAVSAVDQAASDLLSGAANYNGSVASWAASQATNYQSSFNANLAKDSAATDLIILDAQNAVSAISATASKAAEQDSTAFANIEINAQISSANSVLSELTGHTDSTADMQMNSVAHQANASLNSVSNNLNTVMKIVSSTAVAIDTVANMTIASSAHSLVASAADSLMQRAGHLSRGTTQAELIDLVKQTALTIDDAIDSNASYLVSVSMAAEAGVESMGSAMLADLKQDRSASAQIAFESLASSAADQVGALDSFASANFSSAVGSISNRTTAYLADQLDKPKRVNSEIRYAGKTIQKLMRRAIAQSATDWVTSQAAGIREQLSTIADQPLRDRVDSQIAAQLAKAEVMITSDAFDYQLASLDADNHLSAINSLAASAFASDTAAVQSTAHQQALDSAYAKVGSLSGTRSVAFDSQIAALDASAADYAAQLDAVGNHFIMTSANAVLDATVASANHRLAVINDVNAQAEVLKDIEHRQSQASVAISADAHHSKFASLDANNAASAIDLMVNKAVANDSIASATVMIDQAASSVTAEMQAASIDQLLRFEKQVQMLTNNAEQALLGPFTDNDSLVSQAESQLVRLANNYMVSSAYSAVGSLASAASDWTSDLAVADSLNVKAYIDSALNSADSQISVHSAAPSLVADAVNNVANTVEHLASDAVNNSPMAAAKHSLAHLKSSAATIDQSLSGLDAQNFSSAINSVAQSAVERFTENGATINQQALQKAAHLMTNLSNLHAAQGAMDQLLRAAENAEHKIDYLADNEKRGLAFTDVANTIEKYRDLIEFDIDHLALINLDVINGKAKLAAIASAAVKDDVVARAIDRMDRHASSVTSQASGLDSLASANLSSAINDLTARAMTMIQSTDDHPDTLNSLSQSATAKMDSLLGSYVTAAAHEQLANVRARVDEQAALIVDVDRASSLSTELDALQSSAAAQVSHDANHAAFIDLDIANADSAMQRVARNAVNGDVSASAAAQVQGLLATATSRAQPLVGSAAANFSSAMKSMASRANRETSGVYDYQDLDSILAATSKEVSSTVITYLVDSAHERLSATVNVASTAVNVIDGQLRADANRLIASAANSATQMVTTDSHDDQLVSLDAKEASQTILDLADSAVASQPFASASSVIASTATVAMQRVGSLTSFAAANLSSTMNRLNTQARASLIANGADSKSAQRVQSSAIMAINEVANSYVASSASQLIASATDSASAIIARFDNQDAASTANDAIDSALATVANDFAKDRNQPDLMALDATNAINAIQSAALFITTTDEVASGNISISNAAESAYAVADEWGRTTQFDKQVRDIIADSTGRFASGEDVDIVVSEASDAIANVVSYLILAVANARLAALIANVGNNLKRLLNDKQYQAAQLRLLEFNEVAKHTIQKDVASSQLIQLDLTNIERDLTRLQAELVAVDGNAVALSAVADHASAATTNPYVHGSSDDYLNFVSAVNTVVRDFGAELDQATSAAAINQIDSLTQSYVTSQATNAIDATVASLDDQVRDLNNFVIQSSAYRVVHSIASQASVNVQSDYADFSAVSLDADNAISAATSVMDNAVTNDSVASGKRAARSIYSSAASFAVGLSWSDSVEFSMALASQSAATSYGPNANNSYLANSTARFVDQMTASYVASYANTALHNAASQALANLGPVNAQTKTNFTTVLHNVVGDLIDNVASDNADQELVDLDVQNGITMIDSLADSVVRADPGAAGQYIIASAANSATSGMALGAEMDEANFTSAINSVANQASISVNLVKKDLRLVNKAANSAARKMNHLATEYRNSLAQSTLYSTFDSAALVAESFANPAVQSQAANDVQSATEHFSSLLDADAANASYVDLDLANGTGEIDRLVASAASQDPAVRTHLYLDSIASDAAQRLVTFADDVQLNFTSAASRITNQTVGLVSYADDPTIVSAAMSSTATTFYRMANSAVVDSASATVSTIASDASRALQLFTDDNVRQQLRADILRVESAGLANINNDVADDDLLALDIRNVQRDASAAVSSAIDGDRHAAAIHHVQSVAASLSAANSIHDQVERTRMGLQLDSAAQSARADIVNAGSNTDLINVTVEATAASMGSIAQTFMVNDAQSQVAALTASANSALGWFSGDRRASLAANVDQLATVMNSQIDRYALDQNARQLMVQRGQASLSAYVDNVITNDHQAATSAAIGDLAASTVANVHHLSGTHQANFASEVAMTTSSANALNRQMVSDAKTATELQASTADAFDQVARKYVAESGYAALDAVASSANARFTQYGIDLDQVAEPVQSLLRDYNSMVDSDAGVEATVALDCHNASLEMNQMLAEFTAEDVTTNAKWSVQQGAASFATSLGVPSDASVAANYSSAVASVVHSANVALDEAAVDPDEVNQRVVSAYQALGSLTDQVVADSANAQLNSAYSSAAQLVSAVAADDTINAVFNSYANLITTDIANRRFASLDADNGAAALHQVVVNTINQDVQAAFRYRVASDAATISAASHLNRDDQVRFSSAIASVASAATVSSVANISQMNQVAVVTSQQMQSVADYYAGQSAVNAVSAAVSSATVRIAEFSDAAVNAVLQNVTKSVVSAISVDPQNQLATSLYAHDGVAAAESITASLIADHPLVSATERVNSMVDLATHDVLMSDSLADMNFLSAVAKQSLQASDAFVTAESDAQALDELTSQTSAAITSIANSYALASATSALHRANNSAMMIANQISDEQARSRADQGIVEQVSLASSVIANDVADKSRLNLDIANATANLDSVVTEAAAADPQTAFNNEVVSAFNAATSKAQSLTGSLAANYDSAINSASSAVRFENASVSSVDPSAVSSAAKRFQSITRDYITTSAEQVVSAHVAEVKARGHFKDDFMNELNFAFTKAQQTIALDAHDVELTTLDVHNAIDAIDRLYDSKMAKEPQTAFDHHFASQAASASEKIGKLDSHSAANFSSAANWIANENRKQIATFDNLAPAVKNAAKEMNRLANEYVRGSAANALRGMLDSANAQIELVHNYVQVERSFDQVASATNSVVATTSDDPAIVSLHVASANRRIASMATAAVAADSRASAMTQIHQFADSLQSAADFHGAPQQSFAAVVASVASQANDQLLEHRSAGATIADVEQRLQAAAGDLVVQIADQMVTEALDVANTQAIEIEDIHSRNRTISEIGRLVNSARELIKQHAHRPFFAYLDAQNAVEAVAKVTGHAIDADSIANAILSLNRIADQVVAKLQSLLKATALTHLDNEVHSVASAARQAIKASTADLVAVNVKFASAESQVASIANSYVAASANSIVASADQSAATQIEQLSNADARNTASRDILMLVGSAGAAIESDAAHFSYASLDADNASAAISSVTDKAIANDPRASANVMIATQIASTADMLNGMGLDDQAAFSAAVMPIKASATDRFERASGDAITIAQAADQSNLELTSVAQTFIMTSAKAVVSSAADSAIALLGEMFADSVAVVYGSVASAVDEALTRLDGDQSDFATVSLDAYNAKDDLARIVRENQNSYAHSAIDSQASHAASMAGILNARLRSVAINGITRHANAAHSTVDLHFGQTAATLSDVAATSATMDSLINEYVIKDPVTSANSVVASAASSANAKAANLNAEYVTEIDTSVASAVSQANSLIAMNPANSLLDSQLASDTASSMNSFVNMYQAMAANKITTSYAASAYAEIDVMDTKFKLLANSAVATEVDNVKHVLLDHVDEPDVIFDNVSSAATNMDSLVAEYGGQNSSAVVDAKQSFATRMSDMADDVYSQAQVLSINNRGQINRLNSSVANSASVSVSGATTISGVGSVFTSASSLVGSVVAIAVGFARETARAELANAVHDADKSLGTLEPNDKRGANSAIDTIMAETYGQLTIASDTPTVVDKTKQSIEKIQAAVNAALSNNLMNIKDSYKAQINSAAQAAYQEETGFNAKANSFTNETINQAASAANANIDGTNNLAEIQRLTNAGINSIDEANSVAVTNFKTSGSSMLASAANSATDRTNTLDSDERAAVNSMIGSLVNGANFGLDSASNVAEASAAVASGTAAIGSAVESTIASVISSAMAMASDLKAETKRDSIRMQISAAAEKARTFATSFESGAASAVDNYIDQTASSAAQLIIDADNDDDAEQIASSGAVNLQMAATYSVADSYAASMQRSANSVADSLADSAASFSQATDHADVTSAITAATNETKDKINGSRDTKRINSLVNLLVKNLNKLIGNDNHDQFDIDRIDAKAKIDQTAHALLAKLGPMTHGVKQKITASIQSETEQLNARIDQSTSAEKINRVVEGAKSRFEAQMVTINNAEVKNAKAEAKQVISSNSQNALVKLSGIGEVFLETATETISEVIERAYRDIDAAETFDRVTELTNQTSGEINHIVSEAISMNQKMH
ncbi:hypothetical protein MOO44_04670 [Nicoliella spurrieriana]|uniref:Uncharacterized protein n=1 Tax=Nicoliella spurrieriana TaxID=2925830 RepID=A0A976X6Q4_9LACO|nr:hypothetical protein [Nicoliella spurrieriana]UQS87452.1 hypothetical protein MOO44_04670 [Nicoliella spurrieriana]